MSEPRPEIDSMAEARRNLAAAEGTYWEGPTERLDFAQTALLASIAHSLVAIGDALSRPGQD